ncbi:MAG: nucleoside deaminase, partial [Clostridia bacterium]|nr:nucleoside deaminase [Clostridia bacterium]
MIYDYDKDFMAEALALAKDAYDAGEVPVGAVIVKDGEIIAKGRNTRESDGYATHHAEINAIESACKVLGGYRLTGCTLYVTLE